MQLDGARASHTIYWGKIICCRRLSAERSASERLRIVSRRAAVVVRAARGRTGSRAETKYLRTETRTMNQR